MMRPTAVVLCLAASLATAACAKDTPAADGQATSNADTAATARSDTPPPVPATRQRFDFDADTVGAVPAGFSPAHTGRGERGRWEVIAAPDAPNGGRAVAQLDADRTSYRFPLLVLDAVQARDVEVAVAGKPVAGKKDQAYGLVWRYQDPHNYYVVRANALEDNVVLYKVEDGERSDLPLVGKGRTYGTDVNVPDGAWSTLRVRALGSHFTVYLGDRELFAVEDATFTAPGKVGLWTKADSVSWFDDLEVAVFDQPAAGGAARP
jgi:hypothetical protein